MTFRTFTLKDFFDPDLAEIQARLAHRRPFPDDDLGRAGMHFIDLPEANGGHSLPPGGSTARKAGDQRADHLRLAHDWVSRRK